MKITRKNGQKEQTHHYITINGALRDGFVFELFVSTVAVGVHETSPDAGAGWFGPAHADDHFVADAAGLRSDFGSLFETFDGGLRAADRGQLSFVLGNGG